MPYSLAPLFVVRAEVSGFFLLPSLTAREKPPAGHLQEFWLLEIVVPGWKKAALVSPLQAFFSRFCCETLAVTPSFPWWGARFFSLFCANMLIINALRLSYSESVAVAYYRESWWKPCFMPFTQVGGWFPKANVTIEGGPVALSSLRLAPHITVCSWGLLIYF